MGPSGTIRIICNGSFAIRVFCGLRSRSMKRALMVCGGWEGHEPRACAERFVPFLRQEGFEVEVTETLDVYLDKDKLSQ